MGLRMKIYGGSLKNQIFNGRLTKNIIDLTFGFAKKKRVVFLTGGGGEGGVDTPIHTMKLDALLYKKCIKVLELDM